MKVKDLINLLNEDDGDLDVRVEADHGQTAMRATWAGSDYVEDTSEWMTCALHVSDVTEDSDKVFLIQGY